MSSWKSDLFAQFRVFYNKEFTRQKKVTNKLFISVRCVVIAKRGGGVQSARWDSVGCVSMWLFMYIEGYILFFEILRIRGLFMSRFVFHFLRKSKIKNKKISRRRRRLLKFLFLLILFSVEKKGYRINVVV